MKINFEIPSKFKSILQLCADEWNDGNINEFARHEFLLMLQSLTYPDSECMAEATEHLNKALEKEITA